MSSYFVSNASRSNPSEWVSTHVARSMVWSDFGLSCLDYPLDRKNRDTVCTLLTDLTFDIVAVWVVSRPINGDNRSNFEHWCVKIQAPPALISIDFLESKKKGAFGLQQTTATEGELEDFLHYYIKLGDGQRIRKKWNIMSSVTPSPVKNTSYLKYIDDDDLKKLKAFMKTNYNKHHMNDPQLLKPIDIKRKVCDIADFLVMWTETRSHKKVVEKRYNPITGNCQQFAVDLFDYLVGQNYADKVTEVQSRVQSPFDRKRYKVICKNDEKKQQIIEEEEPEDANQSVTNAKKKQSSATCRNVRVESNQHKNVKQLDPD